MKPYIYWILALTALIVQREGENTTNPPKTIEALLVGSPHWSNYQQEGLDVVQTREIDVLSARYQRELETIAEKIRDFKPDKIFIEDIPAQQQVVDSLYAEYKKGRYGKMIRSESVQLGFRAAKKLGHPRLYCVDYRDVWFEFDSIIAATQKANQQDLITGIMEEVQNLQGSYNQLIAKEPSIKEVLLFLNSEQSLKRNLGFYLNTINQAGGADDFAGAYLTSEWYRRNLYIYSMIQKAIEPQDQKIMILMGAGHIAVLKELMEYDSRWELVDPGQIL